MTDPSIEICSSRDATKHVFTKIEEWYESGPIARGSVVPTGLSELDRSTLGWRRGAVTVVAGIPGNEKCDFLIQSARNAAAADSELSVVFALSISTVSDGVLRALAQEAELVPWKVRQGLLYERGWSDLIKAAGDLSGAPIHWVASRQMLIDDLADACRNIQKEDGLDVVFVEAITGLRAPNGRDELVGAIQGLRDLADELDVAVVASAPLESSSNSRNVSQPAITDLYRAGVVGELADAVFLLQVEDEPVDNIMDVWDEEHGRRRRGAEILVAKHQFADEGRRIRLRTKGPPWIYENTPEPS